MGSVTEHFIAPSEGKLIIKLRTKRALKRPKCRSAKLVTMAFGVCFLLSVTIFFCFLHVSDEIEQLPYEGEASVANYGNFMLENKIPVARISFDKIENISAKVLWSFYLCLRVSGSAKHKKVPEGVSDSKLCRTKPHCFYLGLN